MLPCGADQGWQEQPQYQQIRRLQGTQGFLKSTRGLFNQQSCHNKRHNLLGYSMYNLSTSTSVDQYK